VPSRPVGGALSKNGVAPGVLFIGNLFPSASTAVIAASLDNTGASSTPPARRATGSNVASRPTL
jgi:hypothetical protein